jgi:photosystem II stability/assembly factor-like uncharacterized protein
MKSKIFTILFAAIFSFPTLAQSNWTAQNSGTNTELEDVYFVDENNGWVSGNIGKTLHTTDGGQTWSLHDTPANYILYSIFFNDLQNGWAAGYGGAVVHTTDGGENWFLQDNLGYNDIYKLFFMDGNKGWAAGGYYDFQTGVYERVIYNTTDGGTNWNLQYGMAYESELRSIYFTDSNTGYAAGESGIIMKTTNGGNNWFEQQNITGFDFTDMCFTNSTTGFVVGEYLGLPHYSVVFNTTDSGNSWNEIPLGTDEVLAGIYFTDELNGWAVGNDYGNGNIAIIYRTTDGGNNWVKQNIPTFDALADVYFINDTKGWAVGHLGTILTYDGQVPVELTSFTANVADNNVVLNWQTATEKNNSGFEILRSAQNDDSWNQLGFVEGHGTTTEENSYSFTDKDLRQGSYSYKLIQIDFDGTQTESEIVNIEVSSQPTEYSLSQNYPNPFNPSTTIEFSIPQSGNVKLVVYNSLGEEVSTLINNYGAAGNHKINFDATGLPSGLYLYKLSTANYSAVKKMIVLK